MNENFTPEFRHGSQGIFLPQGQMDFSPRGVATVGRAASGFRGKNLTHACRPSLFISIRSRAPRFLLGIRCRVYDKLSLTR